MTIRYTIPTRSDYYGEESTKEEAEHAAANLLRACARLAERCGWNIDCDCVPECQSRSNQPSVDGCPDEEDWPDEARRIVEILDDLREYVLSNDALERELTSDEIDRAIERLDAAYRDGGGSGLSLAAGS